MTLHTFLSFVKSAVRLLGYYLLWLAFPTDPNVFIACFILALAEVVGIVEEV